MHTQMAKNWLYSRRPYYFSNRERLELMGNLSDFEISHRVKRKIELGECACLKTMSWLESSRIKTKSQPYSYSSSPSYRLPLIFFLSQVGLMLRVTSLHFPLRQLSSLNPSVLARALVREQPPSRRLHWSRLDRLAPWGRRQGPRSCSPSLWESQSLRLHLTTSPHCSRLQVRLEITCSFHFFQEETDHTSSPHTFLWYLAMAVWWSLWCAWGENLWNCKDKNSHVAVVGSCCERPKLLMSTLCHCHRSRLAKCQ